jgi:RES domain-containing protein
MRSSWRLTKTKHLSTAWDGEGAKKAGGRWNSLGVAVIYMSGSLSLALVEILVHLTGEILPAYSALRVEFEESLVTVVAPAALPANWRDSPPPPETQAIGDRWVADLTSVVLQVPSVVVPDEFNYVLNPSHPDFRRVTIGPPSPFPFDPRLRRS